ncbi:hypothetical protein ACWDA7_40775 [Streptomyces sp. NPDC001156]
MSDTTGRDWKRMTPADFGARAKANQDALFLVDEPDACGTDVLDGYGYGYGYGFGAVLWAERPDAPPPADDPHPHNVPQHSSVVRSDR